MSFGDYLENELLDHVFGCGDTGTDFTPPTNIYVALSTADPGDDGATINEPDDTGFSYARQSTDGADWGAAAGGAVSNSTAVTFPQATESWGSITHFALFDALTSGNFLGGAILSAAKTIDTDDTAEFAIGDLDVTLA
jgi:hypothetical protein